MNTLTSLPNKARQKGAALMISLIFIFMTTVIGISAMKDATLEGQLANNAIQKDLTLQAAEAASNVLLDEDHSFNDYICNDNPQWENQGQLEQTGEQSTRAQVEYGGQANPIGYSLGGPIGARRFVITGESRIDSVSTGSRVTQGVIFLGAQALGDC